MSAPILRVKTLPCSLRAAWSPLSSLLPEPLTGKGQNSGDSHSGNGAYPIGVCEIRKGATGCGNPFTQWWITLRHSLP